MLSHTITLTNGKQFNLTNKEAKELWEQLNLLFGELPPYPIPTPYTPFQPPNWPQYPWTTWCEQTKVVN